jgi:hypothetical protein
MNTYVKVCSMGGVASSNLATHVMGNTRDKDDFKHCISPCFITQKHPNEKCNLVFLIGNPYNAIVSVFRRGFQNIHEVAMSYGKFWLHNKDDFKNKKIMPRETLHNYLKNNTIDAFHIKEHIYNWTNFDDGRTSIRIVKYENLSDHIAEILKFTGCNKPFAIRKRSSDYRNLPNETMSLLMDRYRDVQKIIADMPSIVRIR